MNLEYRKQNIEAADVVIEIKKLIVEYKLTKVNIKREAIKQLLGE